MPGFSDYQKEIINDYQTKKNTGRLASKLENPSPAQLRDYCLEIWAHRFEKADAQVIKSFFDPGNRYDDIERAIREFDIDRLKPLISFMTKGVQTRDDDNVKLLAWLIDFRPRPYETWREQQKTQKKGDDNSGIEPAPPPEPPEPNKIRRSILGVLMLTTIGFASVFGVDRCAGTMSHQCMYWDDNQYISIGCQEETPHGQPKIALDNSLLNKFERITKPDTLTYHALGRVWYTTMKKDSLVYFTGPGYHPVHKQKNLRPITKYIMDKYIIGKVHGR